MNAPMKDVAAITMLRNDDWFLRRWVKYYASQLGRENLYILFDGKDQRVPDFCEGCNTLVCDKLPGKVVEMDRRRAALVSETANALRNTYRCVIATDVDEFLVLDPLCGDSLKDYLLRWHREHPGHISVSGLGVDVGENTRTEQPIDDSKTFLSQRSCGFLLSRYTKPVATFAPCRWGGGYHRVKGHNFHISPDLYLFHFGCVDVSRIKAKAISADISSLGAQRHIKKRLRTSTICSTKRVRDWDRACAYRRFMQTLLRQPFQLNKPSTGIAKIVVRIPERFSTIV